MLFKNDKLLKLFELNTMLLSKVPSFDGVVLPLGNAAAFLAIHLVATGPAMPWPRLPQGPWVLLLASGKELSSMKEQFPKLPKLGNAAHRAGSTQVSTNLKFSINYCVIGS